MFQVERSLTDTCVDCSVLRFVDTVLVEIVSRRARILYSTFHVYLKAPSKDNIAQRDAHQRRC